MWRVCGKEEGIYTHSMRSEGDSLRPCCGRKEPLLITTYSSFHCTVLAKACGCGARQSPGRGASPPPTAGDWRRRHRSGGSGGKARKERGAGARGKSFFFFFFSVLVFCRDGQIVEEENLLAFASITLPSSLLHVMQNLIIIFAPREKVMTWVADTNSSFSWLCSKIVIWQLG